MCVKLPHGHLNSNPYSLHSTSTNTCELTIALRVCDGKYRFTTRNKAIDRKNAAIGYSRVFYCRVCKRSLYCVTINYYS